MARSPVPNRPDWPDRPERPPGVAALQQALTQGFSTFLRRRRAQRHFVRRPLLASLQPGALAAAPQRATVDAAGEQGLLSASLGDPAQAIALLQSHALGLDAAEAARRLARDGPNEIQHQPPLPGWLRLWRCYLNPFNLLLTALAGLSLLGGDSKAAVVIGCMVLLSTGIRFVQEGRSHRAADGLRALVTTTATVIRPGAGGHHGRAGAGHPGARPGGRRHRGPVGRRHGAGRLPRARRARPVHRPGGDDRRVAAGGEVRRGVGP